MSINQAALLQQHEQTRKSIEATTRHIMLLDRALVYSSARRALDRVFLPGGLEQPEDADRGEIGALHEQHSRERAWRRALRMANELSPLAMRKVDTEARAQYFYTREELQAAISRKRKRLDTLEGSLDWLDHELRFLNPKAA